MGCTQAVSPEPNPTPETTEIQKASSTCTGGLPRGSLLGSEIPSMSVDIANFHMEPLARDTMRYPHSSHNNPASRHRWCLHYTDEKSETQRPHRQWEPGEARECRMGPQAAHSLEPSALATALAAFPSIHPSCSSLLSSSPVTLSHTLTLSRSLSPASTAADPLSQSLAPHPAQCAGGRREMPQSPEAPPNPAHLCLLEHIKFQRE